MAAKASATNHLPDPSGRETTRRAWAGVLPERMPPRVTRRDGCLVLLASVLQAASPPCFCSKKNAVLRQ